MTTEPIEVTCDDCGHVGRFPGQLAGTMQMCPECASYFDIPDGTENDEDDWWNVEEVVDELPDDEDSEGDEPAAGERPDTTGAG